MKNLILLFCLVFSFSLFAQEREVEKNMGSGTYYKYTGTAADTLTDTNQDTIDFVLENRGPGYVRKISVKSRFDVIDGADTTVAISVFGKEFEDDATYVQIIASTLSDAVAADNTVKIVSADYTETTASYASTTAQYISTAGVDTLLTDTTGLSGYPADSIISTGYAITNAAQTMTNATQTVTPLDKSYRFYRVRYIIEGDDATGTGIKIDEIEFKLYN